MGKTLYRKYRSTSFDQVIGQDHITKTLKNSLKNNAVSHAYLLSGPRGVGKTSIARILAYEVNDLPYNEEGNHLDIIEIDAASNRRIDEVRALREKVNIAPTSAKYKIYIIDEVHMLTREAFNALLKTLEEPPEHVIFILATTDIHKLPDTIVSRCITLTLKPISIPDIIKHLSYITKKEDFKISKDALELIAEHGDGSFRDSISLLDQVKYSSNEIERKDVELVLGLAPQKNLEEILSAIALGNPASLDKSLKDAYDHGANESMLAKQISEMIRSKLISGDKFLDYDSTMKLLESLLNVSGSSRPRAALELSLLKTLFAQNTGTPQITQIDIQTKPAQNTPKPIADSTPKAEVKIQKVENSKNEGQSIKSDKSKTVISIDSELWDSILQKLKSKNSTLYGVARMAQANMQDQTLTLAFKFPFHMKQLNQPKNKTALQTVLDELGHDNITIDISLIDDTKPDKPSKKNDNTLKNINNIFGEGEVLES